MQEQQEQSERAAAKLERVVEEIQPPSARLKELYWQYQWLHENLLSLLLREQELKEDKWYPAEETERQLKKIEGILQANKQATAREIELLGEREEAVELRKLEQIQDDIYFPAFSRAKARHEPRLLAWRERKDRARAELAAKQINQRAAHLCKQYWEWSVRETSYDDDGSARSEREERELNQEKLNLYHLDPNKVPKRHEEDLMLFSYLDLSNNVIESAYTELHIHFCHKRLHEQKEKEQQQQQQLQHEEEQEQQLSPLNLPLPQQQEWRSEIVKTIGGVVMEMLGVQRCTRLALDRQHRRRLRRRRPCP